jgi:AAA domain (dynein-related subfamily)
MTLSIDEALQEFNLDTLKNEFEEAEKTRKQIVTSFPESGWATLSLDCYALGLGNRETCYCWWLEYNSDVLGGFGGGSAAKHHIYWSKKKKNWSYEYAKYNSKDDAWEKLRSDFVNLFELARNDDFDALDKLPYYTGRMSKAKTLSVYFPNKFLPIFSRDHIIKFLILLRVSQNEYANKDIVALNRLLLQKFRNDSKNRFEKFSNWHIMQFLYRYFKPGKEKIVPLVTEPITFSLSLDNKELSLFEEIGNALNRKKQLILYGPPGTGKTYTARRFAVWWLLSAGSTASNVQIATILGDNSTFRRELEDLKKGEDGIGRLTFLTFHPSYSYEDFIEGYKPVSTASNESGGGLILRLEDGVFKQICKQAAKNSDKKFLVLIDEINRANIAKVFGELITLLEDDKRDESLQLPQSKQSFVIPNNVYLLGSMNTADKSIKLLDAALRRRFAFKEIMPDFSLLKGAEVGNLSLDLFLKELNERIASRLGREKQIGHSYLMNNGKAVDSVDEFALRFHQEIMPLLQEYCYDNYNDLALYVGTTIVDTNVRTLNFSLLEDPEILVRTLAKEFKSAAVDASSE